MKRSNSSKSNGIRPIKRSSSNLFSSQGSFDECDTNHELQSLTQGPTLNNFKSIASLKRPRTLNGTSSLNSTNSAAPPLASLRMPSGLKLKRRPSSLLLSSSSASSSTNASQHIPLKLTQEQETVVDLIVKKKANVFYSGSAGTGKSIILRTIIDRLTSLHGREYISITASTGLAAATIGGSTLHRWAGIGLATGSIDSIVQRIQRKHDLLASWRNTRVLIIDEISMIDGAFLDKLEAVARYIRKSSKPFGGIQLVLTGDFFQLPPVPKKDTTQATQFCFESQMWKSCVNKTILLTRVFRQKDSDLVETLNSIRFGTIDANMTQFLRSLNRPIQYPDGIRPTELYATRREVESSNARQLEQLPGVTKSYESLDTCPKGYDALLDSSMMVERVLTLKEDAQVMMLKNRPESDLVNGSLGKILFFIPQRLEKKMNELYRIVDEEAIIDVRLAASVIGQKLRRSSDEFRRELQARPLSRLPKLETLINYATSLSTKEPAYPYVRWTIAASRYHTELMMPDTFVVDLPGSNSALQRIQIPIVLCWALSIHKSQGQTIQRLKVDLGNIFEAGQVYVALSRATSKDDLQVVNFDPKKIRANNKVKDFYSKLQVLH